MLLKCESNTTKYLIKNRLNRTNSLFISNRNAHYKQDSYCTDPAQLQSSYDVVVIGAGHNGLVSAAYLQKAGYKVCVLERRHVIGGAAVTEEIIPGFKFSRASYVLSLMRPYIISDLKLKDFGLKFYFREPYSSYTPIHEKLWPDFPAKSLLLSSSNMKLNQNEISKFSKRDANLYPEYEKEMSNYIDAVNFLVDNQPFTFKKSFLKSIKELLPGLKAFRKLGINLPGFQNLLTSPSSKILNEWFESEPLKGTLVTDAVIGASHGPNTPGNGYVLLHHVMGGVDGRSGAWAFVEGGMGKVSEAISRSAQANGAHIFTNMEVDRILYDETNVGSGAAFGVLTKCGKKVTGKKGIFAATTPHVAFNQLLNMNNDTKLQNLIGKDFINGINSIDYTSPVTKINVALSRLPNFSANPSISANKNEIMDWHKCTIHINGETMSNVQDAFDDYKTSGNPSSRPLIEMVIPSSLDPTLSPHGAHVCLLFTQYTPYSPKNGLWSDPLMKERYCDNVFNIIEEYSPGFKDSVVGKDILTPFDLEQTFNLTGGNIFHGSMGLNQIYFLRPFKSCSKGTWAFPETPINGLYLCGSGIHPGGGVMGVPGYLAAKAFLNNQ